MERVTGLGGLFFKAENPEALYAWSEKHLGIKRGPEGAVSFIWRESNERAKEGRTVWAIFPKATTYFQPSRADFMMNFCVADLDGLLKTLKEEGVEIDPHREDYDYGRFAWIMDPEGNRVELWEPPSGSRKTGGKAWLKQRQRRRSESRAAAFWWNRARRKKYSRPRTSLRSIA